MSETLLSHTILNAGHTSNAPNTSIPSDMLKIQHPDDLESEEPLDRHKHKNSSGLRTMLFHSYISRRNQANLEKLRIKQLVKKFFKTYSFSRVKSVVDHPDFYKEFCTVTDGVVQVDDNRIMIMQYQRPDGNHSKKFPIFTSSRFWNDSKEEPLIYQKAKIPDVGRADVLQYKQKGGALVRNAIVGAESVSWYPNGGLLLGDPNNVVIKYPLTNREMRKQTQFSHLLKDNVYQYQSEVDSRNPRNPQIGENWLIYIAGSDDSLIGIKFGSSAQDVTLHVLVAEGVQCFNLDQDQFMAVQKCTTSSQNLADVVHLKDLGEQRNFNRFISSKSQIFLGLVHLRIASDISTNNEFTCIRHLKGRLVFVSALTDYETGQNFVFAGHHLETNRFYKILEIQSLQITARTTPIRHARLISAGIDCCLSILSEDRQLHVFYFLTDLKIFGVLQFNHPVGSEEAEVYSLDFLNSHDIAISGYDVLRIYRLQLKLV